MKLKPVSIKSVTRMPNPHPKHRTWDLQVQEDHTYLMGRSLQSHVVSHNTEARLSAFAEHVLFADIGDDTVDFEPNYDGHEQEPTVLPARVPMLLLTAANGIAVGMATNILPFNLGEVCDATVAVLKDPAIKLEELRKILPAPDFPLGGVVANVQDELYSTGRSSVKFRATATIEERGKRSWVVVTSVPFQRGKAALVSRIAQQVRDGQVIGVDEIRDESSKHGIRICFEVSPRSDPKMVLNSLFKTTDLGTQCSMNTVAIAGGRPVAIGVRDILRHFIAFRRKVVRRRTRSQKKRAEQRKEIVDGVLLAVDNRNLVIAIVTKSDSPVKSLMKRIGLTNLQAEHVFNMPLRRFSKADKSKLNAEQAELKSTIERADVILTDANALDALIAEETMEVKRLFGTPRLTKVVQDFASIALKDMVKSEDVVLTFLNDGTVKSTPVSDYRLQRRRGRGMQTGAKSSSEGDEFPAFVATVNTHDDVSLITNLGNRFRIHAYDIEPRRRGRKTVPLADIIEGFGEKERVVSVVRSILQPDEVMVIVGAKGMMKKQLAESVTRSRDSTTAFYGVDRGGEVVGAVIANENDDVILTSAKGQVLRTSLSKVRPIYSRDSSGVMAFRLSGDDRVLGVSRASKDSYVMTVTRMGFAKKTPVDSFVPRPRTSPGVAGCFLKKGDQVVFGVAVPSDDDGVGLFVMTNLNKVIRMRLSEVRETVGRKSLGTQLKKMEKGEHVTTVTIE